MGVDELVFYARRSGLDFVALTDHDTMAGVNRGEQLGKRYGIPVVFTCHTRYVGTKFGAGRSICSATCRKTLTGWREG